MLFFTRRGIERSLTFFFVTQQQDSGNEPRANEKVEQDKQKEIPTAVDSPTTVTPVRPSGESAEASSTSRDEAETTDDAAKATTAAKSGQSEEAAVVSATAATTNPAENVRLVTCTQCSLIDPLEVHVEERSVHLAEPVLTPIG